MARAAATFASLTSYPVLLQTLYRPSIQLKPGDLEVLISRGVDDFLRIYPPSKGQTIDEVDYDFMM